MLRFWVLLVQRWASSVVGVPGKKSGRRAKPGSGSVKSAKLLSYLSYLCQNWSTQVPVFCPSPLEFDATAPEPKAGNTVAVTPLWEGRYRSRVRRPRSGVTPAQTRWPRYSKTCWQFERRVNRVPDGWLKTIPVKFISTNFSINPKASPENLRGWP